jgi:hypothetical protein
MINCISIGNNVQNFCPNKDAQVTSLHHSYQRYPVLLVRQVLQSQFTIFAEFRYYLRGFACPLRGALMSPFKIRIDYLSAFMSFPYLTNSGKYFLGKFRHRSDYVAMGNTNPSSVCFTRNGLPTDKISGKLFSKYMHRRTNLLLIES